MFIGLVVIIAKHVFSLIFETSASLGKSVKSLFPLQSLESSCPPVHSYWVMCTLRLSPWERQELSMHVICTCWFLYSFLRTCWVSNLIHTIRFVLISLLCTLVTVSDSQHPGFHDPQWIHPFPLFCVCGLPLAVRCLPPSLPYLPGISTACFLLWIFSFHLGFLNSGSGTWPTKALPSLLSHAHSCLVPLQHWYPAPGQLSTKMYSLLFIFERKGLCENTLLVIAGLRYPAESPGLPHSA